MRPPARPTETSRLEATRGRMPAMTNSAVPMAKAESVRIQIWTGILSLTGTAAPRSEISRRSCVARFHDRAALAQCRSVHRESQRALLVEEVDEPGHHLPGCFFHQPVAGVLDDHALD